MYKAYYPLQIHETLAAQVIHCAENVTSAPAHWLLKLYY